MSTQKTPSEPTDNAVLAALLVSPAADAADAADAAEQTTATVQAPALTPKKNFRQSLADFIERHLLTLSAIWIGSAYALWLFFTREIINDIHFWQAFCMLFTTFVIFPMFPLMLAWGYTKRYIWGSKSNLYLAILTIPIIMICVISFFAYLYLLLEQKDGYIKNNEGAVLYGDPVAPYPDRDKILLPENHEQYKKYTDEFHGKRGLMQGLYFSACAFLSISYGEYTPVGIAQFLAVLEAFIGRLLEITLFSIGISHVFDRVNPRGVPKS